MKNLLIVLLTCSLTATSNFTFSQTTEKVKHHTKKEPQKNSSLEEIFIKDGTGSFFIHGGLNQEEKIIEVHYYKPEDYKPNFKVIMVIPGGGRNGDTYRDTWIDHAEKYNLLVLSPSYSEEFYPGHIVYNLGGMVKDIHQINFDEIEFKTDSKEWILMDFDRIFDVAVKALRSTEKKYDIFGHSAGGQIVHRLVLFNPEAKFNHALAANSGWYTLPDFNVQFPYGLKNSPITKKGFKKSLQKNLVVFIGELDDENETRGHLRTTPESMEQGEHRFARGNYFFEKAINESKRLGFVNRWKKQAVKGVGHSYKEMGAAAADYLYGIINIDN